MKKNIIINIMKAKVRQKILNILQIIFCIGSQATIAMQPQKKDIDTDLKNPTANLKNTTDQATNTNTIFTSLKYTCTLIMENSMPNIKPEVIGSFNDLCESIIKLVKQELQREAQEFIIKLAFLWPALDCGAVTKKEVKDVMLNLEKIITLLENLSPNMKQLMIDIHNQKQGMPVSKQDGKADLLPISFTVEGLQQYYNVLKESFSPPKVNEKMPHKAQNKQQEAPLGFEGPSQERLHPNVKTKIFGLKENIQNYPRKSTGNSFHPSSPHIAYLDLLHLYQEVNTNQKPGGESQPAVNDSVVKKEGDLAGLIKQEYQTPKENDPIGSVKQENDPIGPVKQEYQTPTLNGFETKKTHHNEKDDKASSDPGPVKKVKK